MTEQQELFKKAIEKLIASQQGKSTAIRTYLGSQVVASGDTQAFLLLPAGESIELQDLDPDSPTYGEIYAMADMFVLDGSAIL